MYIDIKHSMYLFHTTKTGGPSSYPTFRKHSVFNTWRIPVGHCEALRSDLIFFRTETSDVQYIPPHTLDLRATLNGPQESSPTLQMASVYGVQQTAKHAPAFILPRVAEVSDTIF